MTLEAKLQEERRIRILVEREFAELREKYDILVAKHNIKNNPDADMIRNQMLRSYRL
jgi:ribosomal protein S13